MDMLIQSVNEADLGWKAEVCKYQKHHALYGAHCDDQNSHGVNILAQITDNNEELVEE